MKATDLKDNQLSAMILAAGDGSRTRVRNARVPWTIRGVITSSDVLKNPLVIWQAFGAWCLLRCVLAILLGRSTTFLELAVGRDWAQAKGDGTMKHRYRGALAR